MQLGDPNLGMMGSGAVAAVKFTRNRDKRYKAALTVSDSSQGIFSTWYRFDESAGGTSQYWLSFAARVNIQVSGGSGGPVDFQGYDVGQAHHLQYESGTNLVVDTTTWHHLIMAWDSNFASGSKKHQFYLDGVSTVGFVGDPDPAFNFNYSLASTVGCSMPGNSTGDATVNANDYGGAYAETYFAPGQYLDLSVTANLQKFRTSAGKPAFLGSDGSLPTGTAPLMYFKNPAATCGVNSGTGGNFTVVGTPADTFGP